MVSTNFSVGTSTPKSITSNPALTIVSSNKVLADIMKVTGNSSDYHLAAYAGASALPDAVSEPQHLLS